MMIHDFDLARYFSLSEVEEVYASGAVVDGLQSVLIAMAAKKSFIEYRPVKISEIQ